MRVSIVIVLIASAVLVTVPASAQEISGKARMIDGIRLWVGDTKVRLCGVQQIPPGTARHGAAENVLDMLTNHGRIDCVRVGEGTPCDGKMPPTDRGYLVA
ncbi:MAG: hypothetical protein MJE12_27920 [Alphaproteobacteria bacterium]|nr:hypothetical protein [Alphaproteobacteria bacterium]